MFLLIFPHQLYRRHPGLELEPDRVILVEDSLFFGDHRYPLQFHKQKLWLHRASMKRFQQQLEQQGHDVCYVDYDEQQPLDQRLSELIPKRKRDSNDLGCVDPTDFILEKRLRAACDSLQLNLQLLTNPGFLNTPEENREYRAGKNRWFMADFYQWQRQRRQILMNGDEPTGGQWSFDEQNRKKVPKRLLDEIPKMASIEPDQIDREACQYVESRFADNPGSLEQLYYPTSHQTADRHLENFLTHRFKNFGAYEDAIVEDQSWLWHSVLTPSLNIGLLTPEQIVDSAISHSQQHSIPLNSLEGFLRQVIGWREFIRATYEDLGVAMRTTNHWQHRRPLPNRFYDATTGIPPIDNTIERLLQTGYCHHIERLMVLGGFMFLCEIDPDDIYRWFMEMFVDSYDWVMVPNVYAMSQHADGGLITTKPYFSGSSYVRKMSHYKRGPWCDIWDGLYWRWILNHADELSKNPRWAMMCSMAKKMDASKKQKHIDVAESFLADLN